MTNPYLDLLQTQPSSTGAAPPANPYLAALQADEDQRRQAVAGQLTQAVGVNPDQYNAKRRVAQYLGYPTAAVEALPHLENQAKVQQVQQAAAGSPALQRRYTDADFAKLAHDDAPVLAKIETAVAGAVRTLMGADNRGPSRTPADIVGDAGVVAAKGAVGLPQALVGLADIVTGGYAGKAAEAVGVRFKDAQQFLDTLYSDPQQRANAAVKEADGFVGTLGAMLTNPSTIATAVGESAPQMLGGAAIGRGLLAVAPRVAPWLAAALGEGLLGAGTAAEQSRQDNDGGLLTARQTFAAMGSGAGTALFGALGGRVAQRLGLDDIDTALVARGLTADSASAAKSGFVSAVAKSGLSEGVFEELPQSIQEQMWQNWGNGRPLSEGVGAAAAQGLLAGMAAGGGFQAVGRVAERFGALDREAADAVQREEQLKEAIAQAAQSKLADRSPEQLQAFVAEASGDATVRFDADVLMQVFNQDVQALAQALPSVDVQALQEMAATGGEVSVPMGELVAGTRGTGVEQTILEHARLGDSALSAAEAREVQGTLAQSLQQETERVIAQAQDQAAARASHDAVRDSIKAQVVATGRVRDAVAEGYATFAASFFTAYGSRMGMTAEQFYAAYPLRVLGAPSAGQQGAAPLEQSGEAPVRVLYRGTTGSDARIVGGIAEGTLFAAADESTARSYAGSSGQVEQIGVRPGAKILVEGSAEFAKLTGRKRGKLINAMRKGENLKTAADAVAEQARAAGYDAIEFTSMRDLGIAIFNEQAFTRNLYGTSAVQVGGNLPKNEAENRTSQAEKDSKSTTYGAVQVTPQTETPEQIKSATGNDGSFDANDPSILSQGQSVQAVQAAEAVPTGKISPITRNPIFELRDASGQRIGLTHSYATPEEALAKFNAPKPQAPAVQPTPMVNIDTAPPAAPRQKRATNWKLVRGEKFTNLDEDDGHLYHVTSHKAALDINKEGLVPNGPRMFGAAYAGHSAGRVFLTERSGVSFWMEKVEQQLFHNYDRPPAVAVVRIPKDKITATLQSDKVGSEDAGAPAYYAEGQVLRQEDGKFRPEGPAAPRGTFNPQTLELVLNPSTNLSTFFHESGHFFLEVLADIASQPNAPAQIVEDMGTFLKWTGVQDLATWNAMTLDQQRPYHERWAESIEQYVMEGRAPSVELQPLMRRFATWLKSVYGSIKQFLASRGQVSGQGTGALDQPAYHGTPYRGIEKFDTDKIGTGEGAQAYGWGLYFAGKKDIAEWYRKALTAKASNLKVVVNGRVRKGDPIRYAVEKLAETQDTVTQADVVAYFDAALAKPMPGLSNVALEKALRREQQKARDEAANAKTFEVTLDKKPGQLYEVDIPEDDSMLLWDKPLSEQPEKVREALGSAEDANISSAFSFASRLKPTQAGAGGRGFYKDLSDQVGGDSAASQALAAAGVKGIKYLDGTSRNAGDGTFNYVIFSGDDVQIRNQFYQDPNAPAGPDLQLNDDIRRVMDRMLATDEQIAQANEVAGLVPDEAADAQAQERLRKRSIADLKWSVKARDKALSALRKSAKSIEAGIREQVVAEVEQTPEVRAAAALKGGAAPEVVADAFGYPSADALAKAIDAFGKKSDVVDGMTEQRMLEEHGDLVDERAIKDAANEAVHNEARARSLATELRTQGEMLGARADTGRTNANGSRVTVNALVEAAKQFGANIVGRTPLRDLRSKAWQHTQAERRAAKRWAEATAAGQTADAVKAKQDQMLNHAAARALLDAQDESRKVIDFFKRVAKGNDEETVKKGRDADIVNAARAVLAAYGLETSTTKRAADYLEAVKANDADTYAVIAPTVEDATRNAQPLEALTFDELQGLSEHVHALWHLARRSRQMEVDGDLVDIEEAAQDIFARLEEIGVPDTIPGEAGALTKGEERARWLQFAGALLRRTEQWTEKMDGRFGGPFNRLLFQPIKDAATRYRADHITYRAKFQALVDNVAPAMAHTLIEAPELGYTFGRGHNGIGHAELLHAILHTGNESNKRKLLLGRRWATENADGTLDTSKWDAFINRLANTGVLQQAHFDFAQGVWDLMDSTKPLAQKTHRDVFGRYFAEVTADAFIDPFGVTRSGGYVPAQADPTIVTDASLRALAEMENESMAFSFPATSKGFTKSRVEYNRPLKLDLRTLPQHLDKVLLFSHMEPAVRGAAKLLRQKSVSQPLNRVDPSAYEGMLLPWLNRTARQQVETPIVGDGRTAKILSTLRSRSGAALMFANVSNTVQQITGLASAAVKVGPGHLLRSAVQYLQAPKQMTRTVSEASEFMRVRMDNSVQALDDEVKAILTKPNVYERAQDWSQRHAYFLQQAFDNVLAPIVWTGAYNDAMAQGMDERLAVRFADGTVRQTQGALSAEDVSRIETGPAYARMFTQFISYFNMMANTNITALQQINAEMGIPARAARASYIVTMGFLVPIWLAEAIAVSFKGGPGDADGDGDLDTLVDWLAAVLGMGTIKGLLAQVPFVGALANSAVARFNGNPADDKMSLSPAVSMLEAAAGVPSDIYKVAKGEGNARTTVRDVASLITLATGLPVTAVARPLGYLAGVADDRIEPTGPVDAARGMVTGVPSPASKTR